MKEGWEKGAMDGEGSSGWEAMRGYEQCMREAKEVSRAGLGELGFQS